MIDPTKNIKDVLDGFKDGFLKFAALAIILGASVGAWYFTEKFDSAEYNCKPIVEENRELQHSLATLSAMIRDLQYINAERQKAKILNSMEMRRPSSEIIEADTVVTAKVMSEDFLEAEGELLDKMLNMTKTPKKND